MITRIELENGGLIYDLSTVPPEAKGRTVELLIQGGAEESRPQPRPVPHSPRPSGQDVGSTGHRPKPRDFLDSPLRGERLRLRPIGVLLLLRPPRKRLHNFRSSRNLIFFLSGRLETSRTRCEGSGCSSKPTT